MTPNLIYTNTFIETIRIEQVEDYFLKSCGNPSEEPTIFKKVYESEIVYQSYAEKGGFILTFQ